MAASVQPGGRSVFPLRFNSVLLLGFQVQVAQQLLQAAGQRPGVILGGETNRYIVGAHIRVPPLEVFTADYFSLANDMQSFGPVFSIPAMPAVITYLCWAPFIFLLLLPSARRTGFLALLYMG